MSAFSQILPTFFSPRVGKMWLVVYVTQLNTTAGRMITEVILLINHLQIIYEYTIYNIYI